MFDDDDGGGGSGDGVGYPSIPSPPPLPDDFNGGGGVGASSLQPPSQLLFNFAQFSERMPLSQPMLSGPNQLVKDLTQEALDMAEANVVYGERKEVE